MALKREDFTKKEIREIIKRYVADRESLGSISEYFKCRSSKIRKILTDRNIKIRSSNEALTSEQLSTNKKYDVNDRYFEKINNYDKAYWLGFLFADGYIIDSSGHNGGKRKGLSIGLTLKEEDSYHVQNFKGAISSTHPIKKKSIKLKDKTFFATRFEFGSFKMGEDLISHGCTPRKSLTLEYPLKMSEKYFPAFIHGYFDGDGCAHVDKNNKAFSISILGTPSFLNSVKERLNKYKIETSEIKNDGSKAFNIRILRGGTIAFFNLIYKKSKDSYLLDRKHDKFVKILNIMNREDLVECSELAKLASLIK